MLETLLNALRAEEVDADTVGSVHRTAHSMGSSAAIYGYRGLSIAAREAEAAFASSEWPKAEGLKRLEALIAAARSVAMTENCDLPDRADG